MYYSLILRDRQNGLRVVVLTGGVHHGAAAVEQGQGTKRSLHECMLGGVPAGTGIGKNRLRKRPVFCFMKLLTSPDSHDIIWAIFGEGSAMNFWKSVL